MSQYQFAYGETSVYANVVRLLREHARAGGVVVDLGCGYGAIADPCRELGLTYLGLDRDAEGPDDLRARGFEAETVDLQDAASISPLVEKLLDGRPLAALTMLDTLEHLTTGLETLAALADLARRYGGAPLVLSVPNVTHVDLVGKLLAGRWDVTPTGLLDETHVALYSPGRLRDTTAEAGWREVAARDFELAESDQHFPPELATIAPVTPVAKLLRQIRAAAGPGALANQFVRAYLPGAPRPPAEPEPGPFLSVVTRTQGKRVATLHDTLLCLAAQTCDDFEVVVVAHDVRTSAGAAVQEVIESMPPEFRARVRLVHASGGGRARPLNVGLAHARGAYIAMIDDDDLALANWVERFKQTAERAPGALVRAVVAEQYVEELGDTSMAYATVGPPRCPWPVTFSFVEHLHDNRSPLCGFAFPRSVFTDLGIEFDESLPVLEDWSVVVRSAMLCGVVCTPVPTSVYRRWQQGHHSGTVHGESEWEDARRAVRAKLDEGALLLPPGTASELRGFVDRNFAQGEHLAELRALLVERDAHIAALRAEFESSTSWRLTAPLRRMTNLARRVKGRVRG